ncbi:RNA-binding protein [archaeon]|nr:RNA-binding protein [archaeon]
MSKKIFVGNLPFKYRGKELRDLFSQFGEIEDATVILDKFTKKSKGFGFVTFVNDADADKAVSEMNEKEAEGRPLTVNEAKARE